MNLYPRNSTPIPQLQRNSITIVQVLYITKTTLYGWTWLANGFLEEIQLDSDGDEIGDQCDQ